MPTDTPDFPDVRNLRDLALERFEMQCQADFDWLEAQFWEHIYRVLPDCPPIAPETIKYHRETKPGKDHSYLIIPMTRIAIRFHFIEQTSERSGNDSNAGLDFGNGEFVFEVGAWPIHNGGKWYGFKDINTLGYKIKTNGL